MYAEKIRDVLSRPRLHEEAVKSGFCRRDSKLKPEIFFELLFYCASRTENGSLSFMVSCLEDRFGIEMKKQSPDERFNEKCVDFVKAVLSEILRDKLREVYRPDFLSLFNRMRIKDSTKFVAPAAPAENYKGLGGTAGISPAGICIQHEFDLKSGEKSVFSHPGDRRHKYIRLRRQKDFAVQMKNETRTACRFNLFITDADEKHLDADNVFPLYRLRWQPELMLKCRKSVFKINELQKMKEYR